MTAQQQAMGFLHRAQLMNANHRGGYRKKARQTKDLRWWARTTLVPQLAPVAGKVRVVVWVAPLTRQRRDPSNWAPTAKALVDGLTDGGIWPDDNNDWVEGPDCRQTSYLSPHVAEQPVEFLRRVQVWVTLSTPGQEPTEPAQGVAP